MTRWRGFVFAALFGAGVSFTAGPARARVVEKIAAVVGESVILASEVEEKAGMMMGDVSHIPDPEKRAARAAALRREVLDRLIDDELILQQAAELSLQQSEPCLQQADECSCSFSVVAQPTEAPIRIAIRSSAFMHFPCSGKAEGLQLESSMG